MMTRSQEVEAELADRLANAFEHEPPEVVAHIRNALHIRGDLTRSEIWRAFARTLIREVHDIEGGLVQRRVVEVQSARPNTGCPKTQESEKVIRRDVRPSIRRRLWLALNSNRKRVLAWMQ